MPRLGSLLGDSEKPPFDPLWYGNVHRPGLLVLRCFHKCNIFLASYLPVGRLDGAAVCPLSDKAMKETVERGRVRRLAGLPVPNTSLLFSTQHCFTGQGGTSQDLADVRGDGTQ